MRTNDTITAIATPTGVGGIAVIRISGPHAVQIALKHLSEARLLMQPRHATYGLFRLNGDPLDEVVATYYQAPHSYTGDDLLEIACHGSLYIQQTILETLIADGARIADPGEFTLRAFLNGRFDLSQAEAVADLIESTNQATHHLAMQQLRGGYSQRLQQLRSKFVELTSLMELELDFSDEQVEFADRGELLSLLDSIEAEVQRLIDSFRLGNAVKRGVSVAIVGRPNVGKSTLLNALVGEERAIVSDQPGTTRDTIEDTLTLGGILFRFIDTAGIRHSHDRIEAEGIARSFRAVEKAQMVIYLLDATLSPQAQQQELQEFQRHADLTSKRLIVVYNKVDAQSDAPTESLASEPMADGPTLRLSAKLGIGIEALKQHLVAGYSLPADQVVLTNARHHASMLHIMEALGQVRQGLHHGLSADLVVIDIRDALYHLGQITGQVTNDDILGTIFSHFCIGK